MRKHQFMTSFMYTILVFMCVPILMILDVYPFSFLTKRMISTCNNDDDNDDYHYSKKYFPTKLSHFLLYSGSCSSALYFINSIFSSVTQSFKLRMIYSFKFVIFSNFIKSSFDASHDIHFKHI